MFKIEIK